MSKVKYYFKTISIIHSSGKDALFESHNTFYPAFVIITSYMFSLDCFHCLHTDITTFLLHSIFFCQFYGRDIVHDNSLASWDT